MVPIDFTFPENLEPESVLLSVCWCLSAVLSIGRSVGLSTGLLVGLSVGLFLSAGLPCFIPLSVQRSS